MKGGETKMLKKTLIWTVIATFLMSTTLPVQAMILIPKAKSRLLTEQEMSKIVGRGEVIAAVVAIVTVAAALIGDDDDDEDDEDDEDTNEPQPYQRDQTSKTYKDSMNPKYWSGDDFAKEADKMIKSAQKIKFYYPVSKDYSITSRFAAPRGEGIHTGVDIGVPENKEVYAAHDGYVKMAGWENPNNQSQGYGKRVYLMRHVYDDYGINVGKLTTLYAHLNRIDVSVNDWLPHPLMGNPNDAKIGLSGNTGHSTGPHLHFEIRYYRPGDGGTEPFYSRNSKSGWIEGTREDNKGYWNSDIGYGFGDPRNHGLFWKTANQSNSEIKALGSDGTYLVDDGYWETKEIVKSGWKKQTYKKRWRTRSRWVYSTWTETVRVRHENWVKVGSGIWN